jgi:hypothetical protein
MFQGLHRIFEITWGSIAIKKRAGMKDKSTSDGLAQPAQVYVLVRSKPIQCIDVIA